LDLSDERVSVAAFDFGRDLCVLEVASSDDLADRVGDQLRGLRSAAVRLDAA
jgi:hypothetical protein